MQVAGDVALVDGGGHDASGRTIREPGSVCQRIRLLASDWLGQELCLAAPSQQVAHHVDGQRPGVGAAWRRSWQGRDDDGPGS